MDTSKKIIKILKEIANTGYVDSNIIKNLTIEEQELINGLHENGLINGALDFLSSVNVENNWDLFKKKISVKEERRISLWKKIYKYAAVFIFLLSCTYFLHNRYKGIDNTKTKVAFDNSIELVQDNGDVKILNANGKSKIVKKNGEVICKQKGNTINYKSNKPSEKLAYNELRVPYGKTFNISLSDGTKVYLNSGTTLKYFVNFIKGKNREVFLEGEAYFEVSKDSLHPFIVNANDMNVKVLGTKFNVSSYNDDNEINTILIEGSVSLTNDNITNKEYLLKPGYKGSWNKSQSEISFEKVDTRKYPEWMKGDIIFRNSTFEEMTKKLERNYNVTIENYNKELSLKRFNASFNKNVEDIDDIMVSISKTYPFTYEKTDNKIIIKAN